VGQTTGDARGEPRRRAVGACALILENGRAVADNALTETDTPHMVVAQIGFRAKPHKRPEILSAIDEMIDRMRTSSGCGRSRLVVDCEDPNAFTVLSEWQSTDAANAFLESRGFQLLRGIRMLLRGEPLVVLDEVQQRVTRLLH
jgi:quinol monooxygenase YgiN